MGQLTQGAPNNPQPLYHNSRPQVSRSMMPRILGVSAEQQS